MPKKLGGSIMPAGLCMVIKPWPRVPTGDVTMCAAAGNPWGELKYQDAAIGLFRAPRSAPSGVVIVVVVVELKNWACAAAAADGVGMDRVQGRRNDLPFFAATADWWLLLLLLLTLLLTIVEAVDGGGGAIGLPPLPPIGPYLPFTANSNGTNSSGSAKIESDLCNQINMGYLQQVTYKIYNGYHMPINLFNLNHYDQMIKKWKCMYYQIF